MKASVYYRYGNPQVLEIAELDKPIPTAQEVLIRVHATTVNRTDCALLTAKPFIMRFVTGLFKPKNPVLGTDFAGEIEAVGSAVKTFKVGDKVFGFDDMGVGSHAQYLTFPEDKGISLIPDSLSFEEAVACLEGAHYAYNVINKVKINEGQKALVNGASGAIGSAALQMLKYLNTEVTAVCNTKNIQLMKSLGADHVIDYLKEDFTQTGQRFDLIVDAVGKSTFPKCKPLLLPGGHYISSELGPGGQNIYLALVTPLTKKFSHSHNGQKTGKKVIFPIPLNIKKSILFIKSRIEEGKFTPVIDRTYPLEEVAEAFRYVLSGQKTGNVIITMV